MTNFEIYRYKSAGISNLGILKLVKFYHQHPKVRKLNLRQTGQITETRSLADFIERYKSQEIKEIKRKYQKFPSISILDEDYPENLRQIYNPPAILFYKGNIDLLKYPKIAFVGSRDCDITGVKSVEKLIKGLGQNFVIVSGLARGIDTASHIAAVKKNIATIAVIGTGLNVYYPKENRSLQEHLMEKQLVLTEYGAGERALKFHFPERNRIIAGLSRGVVVAEAKMRSGSLITAERAIEEGRDVFAIPGSISDGKSDGCNHLIQEGAKLVTNAQDILEEYHLNLN
ncbi:DNA-processing protein DprA [Lactovum odontotermitis]